MSEEVDECRICFEIETVNNPLIQPCSCKGTSKNVHIRCLEKWRNTTENPAAKLKCMECGVRYLILKKYPLEINPLHNSILSYKNCPATFFNFLILTGTTSSIVYAIDQPTQTSLVVFSMGNNWYTDTLGYGISQKNLDICFFYYYSLGTFVTSIFIFIYYYLKIYYKINRRASFWKFVKPEVLLLNIFSLNFYFFFVLFAFLGHSYMEIFLLLFFSMGGAMSTLVCWYFLSHITQNGISFLNDKINPEQICPHIPNPLNIAIDIGDGVEMRYNTIVNTDSDDTESKTENDSMIASS